MIVDSIKNYLSDDKKEEFVRITNQVYKITEYLNDTYSGYKEWYFKKQVKGCYTPNRNIIFIRTNNNEIAGLICLKKTEEEKKICTFYVDSKYRNQGVGSLLFEESIKYLETTKPLATFSEDKLTIFEKIIEKYDWCLTEIIDSIYNKGVKELCYNGKLTKTHKK